MDTQTELSLTKAELALPKRKRIFIISHPGSGTCYMRDLVRGDTTRHPKKVAHEAINPHVDPKVYRAVISTRYWDFTDYDEVWHFVREPARTIYSAAAVFYQKKARIRFFGHFGKLGEDEDLEPTGSATYDMMKSVYLTNERAAYYANRRYRLEDLPPRPNPKKYRHVKIVCPLEELWEEMAHFDRSLAHALRVQATNYGY